MATENVEDGAKPSSSNETDGSLEKKIGLAKKFDKEMKDYAKATVKEFLGIYGYEEDVDINMDDSGEAHKTGAATNVESSKESGTSSETNQPSRPTLGESASTTDCASNEHARESEVETGSNVILSLSEGPIRYAIVSTCENSSNDTTAEETLQTPVVQVVALPKPVGAKSGAIGTRSRSVGKRSRSVGKKSKAVRPKTGKVDPSSISPSEKSKPNDVSSGLVVATSELHHSYTATPSALIRTGDFERLKTASKTLDPTSEVVGTPLENVVTPSEIVGATSKIFGTSIDATPALVGSLSAVLHASSETDSATSESSVTAGGTCDVGVLNQMNFLEMSERTSHLSVKEKNRLRMRWKRMNETPECRESRQRKQRDRARERRANESEGQREFRLARDRIRKQLGRTNESDDHREKRLLQQRLAARRRRATESPESKQERLVKNRERTRRNREAKRAGVVTIAQMW